MHDIIEHYGKVIIALAGVLNGIKLRKSRITHSVVWDFFMEKY